MTLRLALSAPPAVVRPVARPFTWPVGAVLAATLAGLLLRIAMAGGDLGHDEAFSLALAARLGTIGDAFIGLPHDNNHPLNTAMLAILGPARPAWAYRSMAVVFGTLTVPALAWVFWPKDHAAAVVAACLGAVALPLVDAGSEARGYAGLWLAAVVAVGCWDRALADAQPSDHRCVPRDPRWGLGLASAFGLLNHLGMVLTLAVLGVATLGHLRAQGRQTVAALRSVLVLFWPTAFCVLPVASAAAVAVARVGRFTVADAAPFSFGSLVGGFGSMLGATLGLPDTVAPLVPVGVVLVGIALAQRRRLLSSATGSLALAALVVLPALVWIARPPNVGYARYYAICGLALLLAEADGVAHLLRRSGEARIWASLLLIAIVSASVFADVRQIALGRASASATLAIMRREGAPTYAADHPFMAALLLDRISGPKALPVAPADLCRTPPDWFIAVGTYDPQPDGRVSPGQGCAMDYRRRAAFASNTLSGTQWTLYRRAP